MAERNGNIHKPYVMAALGRCLKLGDLYDYRLDKVFAGNLNRFCNCKDMRQQMFLATLLLVFSFLNNHIICTDDSFMSSLFDINTDHIF